jgi:hypothetical protein
MHSARNFRLVFCVDVYGCMEDFALRLLQSAVDKEVADGEYKNLASGPPKITCERRTIRTRTKDYYAGATDKWVLASAL